MLHTHEYIIKFTADKKNHMTMVELQEGTRSFSGWREEKGSFFYKDIDVYIGSNKVLDVS